MLISLLSAGDGSFKRVSSSDFRTRPLDERGNIVAQDGTLDARAQVSFAGRNNRLVVDGKTRLDKVAIRFRGDNAQVTIGALAPGERLSLDLSVADGASIEIGAHVTTEKTLTVATAQGAQVRIGAGTHLGPNVSVVADDSRGLGPGQEQHRHDVSIGSGVWIMRATEVRAGTKIGDGAVLEMVPLVDDEVPAGMLVRGLPATAVRPVTWTQESLSASR